MSYCVVTDTPHLMTSHGFKASFPNVSIMEVHITYGEILLAKGYKSFE